MPHTQDTRLCQIHQTVLPENTLLVGGLSATESVSRLFQVELDLLSPRRDLRPETLLGQKVSISIELNNASRRFLHGFVSRFAQGDVQGELFTYRAEVVPWTWFLTRNVDCRIFQDQTVPQILNTIFDDDYGFKGAFEIHAPSVSTPREYCVQYRETDFHFVSRLMEEEGLFYFFRHDQDQHVLVISDGSSQLPLAQPSTASMQASGQERQIERWFAERELHSGTFATAEFNVTDRSVISSVELTDKQIDIANQRIGNNSNLAIFDFPSEQTTIAASDRRAQLRMQAEEASAARHTGVSNLPGFSAGHRFTLAGHFHEALNSEYMLTSVHHSVTQEVAGSGASTYFNSFSAVRSRSVFRPPLLTPKPTVNGPQTAIVVGKSDPGKLDPDPGEDDIDVDSLGRVLVKFHWDRSGPSATRKSKQDQQSSCRARVSQIVAGKNWGAAFWPRIGQEVIVEFIEGDPDRPIITGRVYNGKFMPPYDLPAKKTQSGVKTRSTPGGEPKNFNEIRFEDKKGQEELSIHAERNLSVSVEADESHTVGGNRTATVTKNENERIKGTCRIQIDQQSTFITQGQHTEHFTAGLDSVVDGATREKLGSLDVHVLGSENRKVDGGVSLMTPSYGAQIDNNYGVSASDIHLTATNVVIDGATALTIKAGGSFITLDASGVSIVGALIQLNSGGSAGRGAGITTVTPQDPVTEIPDS